MNESSYNHYNHSKFFNLNFLPGFAFLIFLLMMVYILPSNNKFPGYAVVSVLIVWFWALWVIEKRRVSEKLTIDDESIIASGVFTKTTKIHWNDVNTLNYSGKGLFLIGWKLERFLYAEIVSKDGMKIVIRRDIPNFSTLIGDIEAKTGKSFVSI